MSGTDTRPGQGGEPVPDPEAGLFRLGVVGTVVVVAAMLVALNSTALGSLFGNRDFVAQFTEAGGLTSGDDVVVSGVAVGKVREVTLSGDHVDVGFELSDSSIELGRATRATIRAKTALGKKVLAVTPGGGAALSDGGVIPVGQTTPPYDITDALSQLTRDVGDVHTDQLAQSFQTLAGVLGTAAPQVRPALDGVTRLSRLVAVRDTELSRLLEHSAGVTGVLAERDQQIRTLFGDGTVLLAELNRRSDDIAELQRHTAQLAEQVSGLVDDNRAQLGPAFDQLNDVLATLRQNKRNIDMALTNASPALRELGEAVSGFPGFNVYVANLLASNAVPGVPGLLGGTK